MRKLGAGFLGLLAGLLVGIVAQELLASLLVQGGRLDASLPLAVLIGFLMPGLALVGVVVALAIDGRVTKHRSGEEQ